MLATRCVLQHDFFSEDLFVNWIIAHHNFFLGWIPAPALVPLSRVCM